jgi:hypothetical protein
MITELLAQSVEELSIRNARMGYKKPRKVPRPDYVKGDGQAADVRRGQSEGAPNAYRSAINRLVAHQPSRSGSRLDGDVG